MSHSLQKGREKGLMTFGIALAAAFVIFLPYLILDKGYFIYYGDFNVQQIVFYRQAHDAVRSGNIFWSWTTDLGANFIGSYSFYLLGSPFFWLTIPFPSAAVPYLMAPLLILKFACSAATAYLYLRCFVKPEHASLGALLYAFSGFSLYNVFFNHFHEAIVYFPLMLWGMEKFMKDGRRGVFAIMVALSALNNYYFFIGQAIFLILYWFVRMGSPDWECSYRKFGLLVFEAVVGTALAGVLLMPSYLSVVQNSRVNNTISGWRMLIYGKEQRLYDIIHSFFFPQDIPARPNFFPDADNKWASMSAWLPVFGCTGAIAYFQSRKHTDWLRRMLLLCVTCALVPVLNSMFQLFNSQYYARWFYMMVLMLVTATVCCFEQEEETPVDWKRAFLWSGGITAAFALFIGLTPSSWKADDNGNLTYGLYKYADRFWIYVGIAAIGLVLAWILVSLFKNRSPQFSSAAILTVACVCAAYGCYYIGLAKATSNYPADYVIEQGIRGRDRISLPDDGDTVRIDVYNSKNDFKDMDNLGMFWNRSTIQAFHSIVPGSIAEFYDTIDIYRGVASRPDTAHYALRGLTSVHWLFEYANDENWVSKSQSFESNGITEMPGWVYFDKQNGCRIYENQYYIPMGFTYDHYLTRAAYDALSKSDRELALLKALVIPDEYEAAVSTLLSPLDTNQAWFTEDAYLEDCEARRQMTADRFTRDNRGFSADITLDSENYVFFSVPYEKGWTATVNGESAEIVQVAVGFMAVRCPAGSVTIRFDYMTPGLRIGLCITLAAALLLTLYILLCRKAAKKQAAQAEELPASAYRSAASTPSIPREELGLPPLSPEPGSTAAGNADSTAPPDSPSADDSAPGTSV